MMRDVFCSSDYEVVSIDSCLFGEQVLPIPLNVLEMSGFRFSRSSWQANLSSGR